MLSRAPLIALTAAVLFPASALAAPPANDHWADRTPLPLPSQSSVGDLTSATTDASDPVFACGFRSTGQHSVWYSHTTGPESEYVTLSTAGSTFGGALLAVYEGSPGSFRLVTGGCVDGDARAAALSGVRLRPNTAYSIELAAEDGPLPGTEASLSLTEAPVYRVTTTLDGSATCTAGACTLRAAIDAANAAPGAVVVPAGHYTLDGPAGEDANAGGDLDVRPSIGVYGAGAAQTVIDAGHADRVLHVQDARGSVAVTGLTLRNGNADGDGGGLLSESGGAFVDLDGVAVESSHADGGGGLAISGSGRLARGMVTANTADVGAGLLLGRAGAVFQVSGSTLAGNVAALAGGIGSAADLALVNSTLSGNDGGGLVTGGRATLRSVTIAGNSPSSRSIGGAGGITLNEGTLDVRDSVLADSRGGPDCAHLNGAFTATYTHAEDPGGCDFSGAGDVTGADPGLLPLADNGGSTLTQRVAIGSPVLDSGDPAGCRDADGVLLATDQRGLARSVGARCDKGAVENDYGRPVTPPFVAPVTGPPVAPQPGPAGARHPRPVVSKLSAIRHGRALRFILSSRARTTVRILRGKKLVKTYRVAGRRGANILTVSLRRGRYRVRLTARTGTRSTTVTRALRLGRR